MVPINRSARWRKNATNKIRFRLKDVDTNTYVNLTGCTVAMSIKTGKSSSDSVILSLTTTNGKIILSDDGTTPVGYDNWVTITSAPTDTNNLSVGSGVYDVRITYPDATVDYPVEGTITFDSSVT